MTQEEKLLLFQDLSARLPYGIIINTGDEDLKLDRQHQGIGILYPEDCSDEFNERNNNASFYIIISGCYYGEEIKPYLRSISSMTDEEQEELNALNKKYIDELLNTHYPIEKWELDAKISYDRFVFYNSHHFDWNGLIPKKLALEAKEGMYNINN